MTTNQPNERVSDSVEVRERMKRVHNQAVCKCCDNLMVIRDKELRHLQAQHEAQMREVVGETTERHVKNLEEAVKIAYGEGFRDAQNQAIKTVIKHNLNQPLPDNNQTK